MTTSDGDRRPALLDVNVLVAMVWNQHVHHRAARAQFASVAEAWATTAITESRLLRILMTPAVMGREVSGAEAPGTLRGMRSLAGWQWVDDDASLAEARIDTRVLQGRRQVTDLHLVDLCARHSCRLVTFDAGLVGPLVPADREHVMNWHP